MSTLLIVDGTSGNPVYALVHLVEIRDLEVSNRLRRTRVTEGCSPRNRGIVHGLPIFWPIKN